jgi:hypothetical protein
MNCMLTDEHRRPGGSRESSKTAGPLCERVMAQPPAQMVLPDLTRMGEAHCLWAVNGRIPVYGVGVVSTGRLGNATSP